MSSSSHSPLPWQRKLFGDPVIDANEWMLADAEDRLVAEAFSAAAHATILHRVNTYEALVGALKAIKAAHDIKSLADIVAAMPAVRAALKQAEALS